MAFSGFIYEIISTGENVPEIDDTVPAIIFIGAQIYVVAALLGLFILSIYGNYIVQCGTVSVYPLIVTIS